MRRNQAGDSLIEIIIAVVVIGIVTSALVAAIMTNENGTESHREMVTADHVLRSYAETVKSDVRTGCTAPGALWTSSYGAPTGYSVNSLSAGTRTCPATTSTQQVDLTVTPPDGHTKTLSIKVRTP